MEETPSMLHNALTAFLLIGGLITATLLFLHQRRNPPDRKLLTAVIADRSWNTQQAIEKIRRQKRRRSRRAKAKMLDDKSKQASKKQLRGRVRPDE